MSEIKSLISFTFKTMGFDMKSNSNRNIKVDFLGNWSKFGKKFAFIINNKIDESYFKTSEFVSTENFCKSNKYKLIIISNNEKIEGFVSDTYKVISLKDVRNFNKDLMKCILVDPMELKKIVS